MKKLSHALSRGGAIESKLNKFASIYNNGGEI